MWNDRYAGPAYLFGTEPAQALPANADLLPAAGTALCVADGEGRNSVWLAARGLSVTAFDPAPNALAKARALAASRGVSVDFVEADVGSFPWGAARFDLVAGIFVQFADPALRARMFEGMRRALKPGGTLVLHGYTPKQLDYRTGGPSAVENLYTENMLRAAFPDLEILRLRSYETQIEEGAGHSGMSALIDLVARA